MKTLVTHVAHVGNGEHMFMGQRVLGDLLGHESLTGLFALAVLGRRISPEEARLLDGLSTAVTAADPRIWPLKASRIAASYGDMLAGRAVGQLAMMGTFIGPRIIGYAAEHLQSLHRASDGAAAEDMDRVHLEHVTTTKRLAGFGVPFRPEDERLTALRRFMKDTGRDQLPYWRAQEGLSAFLVRDRGLPANVGIGIAAGLLDLGCTPTQAGALGTMIHQQDFDANCFEAAQQRSPELQRLPETCVSYVGTAARRSPRATEERRPAPVVSLYADDGLPYGLAAQG
ncbi:MAG TPA: hypothetical protein VGL81_22930 [Polyangiaceae bacterium]|jgi:hypothetical protein